MISGYELYCKKNFVFACPIIAKSQYGAIFPHFPSNIRIFPHISVFSPEFNFRYQRSGLKVQGKMMHKDMHKIVFAFVQLANIFVWSLVSKIFQTMSICTMTLETVCKIYPRR
jgi:hypothetical protein